ncbi:MAG TPA: hypothetical protein VK636_08325 [Gemmatimonadaceae bacterium]|nr:hypothetical protein [Gemmatimonadaceae bacterium]
MFFRGRQPEASIWRRFRVSADAFTFVQDTDHYAAHVVANAERVVDLFYTLTEHLPPAVDIVIDDLRSGRSWKGEAIALPDVREVVARLKLLLARYGGVELSAYTPEDQLTLNPYLELFIYARTDRWLYLLEGKGLEEQSDVHGKTWKTHRQHFPAAPDLVNAVTAAAERLGLQSA